MTSRAPIRESSPLLRPEVGPGHVHGFRRRLSPTVALACHRSCLSADGIDVGVHEAHRPVQERTGTEAEHRNRLASAVKTGEPHR